MSEKIYIRKSILVNGPAVCISYHKYGMVYEINGVVKDNVFAMTRCEINYGQGNIETWEPTNLIFTKSAPPSIPNEIKIFALEELETAHEAYKDIKWCEIDHVEHRTNSLQYLKENQ